MPATSSCSATAAPTGGRPPGRRPPRAPARRAALRRHPDGRRDDARGRPAHRRRRPRADVAGARLARHAGPDVADPRLAADLALPAAAARRRRPAAVASLLLTIQPIGAVILAAIIFGEAPTALQVAGVVALLAALVAVAGAGSEREPQPSA